MTDLLVEKTILITGASAGIGEHSARLFAREGARMVLTARRLPELERVTEIIRDDGGDVIIAQADTTVSDDLDRAIDVAVSRWGSTAPSTMRAEAKVGSAWQRSPTRSSTPSLT